MTEQEMRKLKSVYGICLSILTGIVGVLFILQTWSIFLSAERSPYTAEIIGQKLLQILVPICLWVAAVIGGGVINALYPNVEQPIKGYVPSRLTLSRLKARLSKNEGGMSALKREETLRKVLWSICAGIALAAIVGIALTLLSKAYTPLLQAEFFTGHNAVADRLVRVCILVGIAMALCVAVVFIDEYSVKREIGLVKTQLAENAKQGTKPAKTATTKKITLWEELLEKIPLLKSVWWKKGLQIGLFAIGITLLVIGIANGGMTDVFEKARNICTQCIGLG